MAAARRQPSMQIFQDPVQPHDHHQINAFDPRYLDAFTSITDVSNNSNTLLAPPAPFTAKASPRKTRQVSSSPPPSAPARAVVSHRRAHQEGPGCVFAGLAPNGRRYSVLVRLSLPHGQGERVLFRPSHVHPVSGRAAHEAREQATTYGRCPITRSHQHEHQQETEVRQGHQDRRGRRSTTRCSLAWPF
jgi:hypothetical protein